MMILSIIIKISYQDYDYSRLLPACSAAARLAGVRGGWYDMKGRTGWLVGLVAPLLARRSARARQRHAAHTHWFAAPLRALSGALPHAHAPARFRCCRARRDAYFTRVAFYARARGDTASAGVLAAVTQLRDTVTLRVTCAFTYLR